MGADSSTTFSDEGSTSNVSYSGGYTAEWIAEDYALSSGSLAPFADYGSVTFLDLKISLSSWNLTTNDGLEMVQYGVVLSTPSPPSGDGFTVSYTG